MALTIDNNFKAAALDGGLSTLNGGQARLENSGGVALATLGFAATAFAAASATSPASATSNAITPASSPTAGTITAFKLRTSGGSDRIGGTVGTSGADMNVTSNVIPSGTTLVQCPGGITVTMQVVGA